MKYHIFELRLKAMMAQDHGSYVGNMSAEQTPGKKFRLDKGVEPVRANWELVIF